MDLEEPMKVVNLWWKEQFETTSPKKQVPNVVQENLGGKCCLNHKKLYNWNLFKT
jgi:hypothetical protein